MAFWWTLNLLNYGGVVAGKAGPGYNGGPPSGSVVNTWETNAGKAMPVLSIVWPMMQNGVYQHFVDGGIQAQCQNIWAADRLPFVTFQAWDPAARNNNLALRPAAIAAGNHDAFFNQVFAEIAAFGHPFWLRMPHQFNVQDMWAPNGDFPWCVGSIVDTGNAWTNLASDIRGMFARMRQLRDLAGAFNCSLLWCPYVRASFGKTSTSGALAPYYPDNAPPDWMGADGSQDGYAGTSGQGVAGSTLLSLQQIFRGGSGGGFLDTWGEMMALDPTGLIPFFIPETNCSLVPAPVSSSRAQRALYYQDALEVSLPALPRLAGVGWSWQQSGTPSYYAADLDLTSPTDGVSPAVFNLNNTDWLQFKRSIGSPAYLAVGQFDVPRDLHQLRPFWLDSQRDRYRKGVRSQPGLVGYWRGLDSASPVLDDSGGSHNAVLHGAATLNNPSVVPANPQDTSMNLPGTSADYFDAGDWPAASPLGLAFSLEASFLVTALPTGNAAIVSKGSASNYEFALRLTATGIECVFWTASGNTFANVAATVTLSLNVPHHVVVVYDPTNTASPMSLVLDGDVAHKTRGGPGFGGTMTDTASTVQIGRRGDGTQVFTGRIGHVVLYAAALTDQTIIELHAAWSAAPQLSGIAAVTPTSNTATVTWTTDIGATSEVELWQAG